MNLLSFDRRKIFVVSAFLGFLLIILITVSVFLSTQKTKKETEKLTPSPLTKTIDLDEKRLNAKSFPQVQFSNWVFPATAPLEKKEAQVYSFQTSFKKEYVVLLARKFGLTGEIKEKNNYFYLSQSSKTTGNQDNLSFFVLDKNTGGFSYVSSQGIVLDKTLLSFVQELTSDQTLSLFANYKDKRRSAETTYFEFHRDWQKVGLPILNSFGLLNLPENQPLRALTFASKAGAGADSNIYATSDKADGLARLKDFNTLTVGITTEGGKQKIISISSNIRPFKKTVLESSNLITFSQAKEKIVRRNYEYILTSPAGSGLVDFSKVYPQNKAVSENAQISECILAYIEKPPSVQQNSLFPYFLCRGTAQLTSGYRVNFVAATSAVLSSQSLLGVFAQDDTSQKQGTLGTPAPTKPPSQQQQSLPPPVVTECKPSVDELTETFVTADGVTIGIAQIYALLPTRKAGWFFVPPAGTSYKTIDEITEFLQGLIDELKVKAETQPTQVRDFDQVFADYLDSEGKCPVWISTVSPSLFIYNNSGQGVEVKHGFNVTYFDKTEDYIYYEYEKKQFNKPDQGWVVEKKDLSGLSASISDKLGLTPLESQRLLFELNHAATDVSSDRFFVGLIPQSEVENKLPLTFSPQPQVVYRLHFYVSSAEISHLRGVTNGLTLQPVTRKPFMVLELGAAGF